MEVEELVAMIWDPSDNGLTDPRLTGLFPESYSSLDQSKLFPFSLLSKPNPRAIGQGSQDIRE